MATVTLPEKGSQPEVQPQLQPAVPIADKPTLDSNWEERAHSGDRFGFWLWAVCFIVMALRIWYEILLSLFRP